MPIFPPTARSAGRRRLICIFLLTSVAAPLQAQPPAEPPAESDRNEIIVTGIPLELQGIAPERSLDADQIDAYGVSTVGELFEQVLAESGESDNGPVVLVNGERVSDLGDAADYPVEAVTRIDILPRGSAARVGGAPQRRVVSITLRKKLLSLTATAGYRFATEGEWTGHKAEALFTRINGPRRINVALRIRREDRLLESERGLVQPQPSRPFDRLGNVVADPRFAGSEIDPALSALAGGIVTRAAVPPGNSSPTLQSFAAVAGQVNVTDLGDFRTLRPGTDNLEMSLSAADRLAPWLRATLQARLSYDESESRLGLASGTFVLPAGTPFSPFTRAVGIAAYGPDPLRQRSSGYSALVTLGLNADVGNWQLNFTGNYNRSDRRTATDRQDSQQASQPILLTDPAGNPFDGSLGERLAILSDRSRSLLSNGNASLRATGSPFSMPAGQATMTLGAGLNFNEVIARNSITGRRRYYRSQRDLFVNGDIPLASRRGKFLPGLGELSASYELGLTDISDFGTLFRYSYGLAWAPLDRLRLTAIENGARRAPDARVIGDAAVVTSGVRYFDFLTGQTVDVTQIAGGNPLLLAERATNRRLGVNAGPFKPINLRLNAEYNRVVTRNSVSSLPPASAAILLAFPERFLRDGSGALSLVDIRSVNFTRQRLEQLRYGFNFAVPIGRARARPPQPSIPDEATPPEGDGGEGEPPPALGGVVARLRLQVAASHTIILNNDVVIRPTLPTVDLLSGGAIGIGGAPSRHQVNLLATLGTRGIGTVVSAQWRSASSLVTAVGAGTDRLRFSPLAVLNLRAFVAGTRLFPKERWLRGSRFSVSVANLLNDRQRVLDSAGATPLRYQPGYRDPLGRTVEIEFRKVF
ncbi:MAG TPA: MoaD/ThiS family protein [Allosphingosinicella sp.]|nr:MoaD/ThiS family protein [Allosphingosinicella sp.]